MTGEDTIVGYKTTQSNVKPYPPKKSYSGHRSPLKTFYFTTKLISAFGH